MLTATQQAALNVASIDNKDFQNDVELVLEGPTGAFRAGFEARSKDLESVW